MWSDNEQTPIALNADIMFDSHRALKRGLELGTGKSRNAK